MLVMICLVNRLTEFCTQLQTSQVAKQGYLLNSSQRWKSGGGGIGGQQNRSKIWDNLCKLNKNLRFAIGVHIFVRFSSRFWQFCQDYLTKQHFNAICGLLSGGGKLASRGATKSNVCHWLLQVKLFNINKIAQQILIITFFSCAMPFWAEGANRYWS